jgi:hypothetical protein
MILQRIPAWLGSGAAGQVMGRTSGPPAPHRSRAAIQHVSVDHRRAHVAVPQQLLNGTNVVAVLEQMRRERMPKRVRAGLLGQSHPSDGVLHGALEDRLVQVVAPSLSREAVPVSFTDVVAVDEATGEVYATKTSSTLLLLRRGRCRRAAGTALPARHAGVRRGDRDRAHARAGESPGLWRGEALAVWRSTSGFEVDFIIGDHTAVEVKAKENVSPQDTRSRRALAEEKRLRRYLCMCLEPRPRRGDGVEILPIRDFLEALWDGQYR